LVIVVTPRLGYSSAMRILTFVLLMVGLSSVLAGVYRWVDPTGQVHYSDQPGVGAKEVELREATVYTPVQPINAPTTSGSGAGQDKPADTVSYQSMTITAPADDEAIRSNEGMVSVTVALEPVLFKGHKIRVYLDGTPASGELATTSITLQNVDRGTHTLQASVIDAQGKELIRAPSVTFHMLRIAPPRAAPFSRGG